MKSFNIQIDPVLWKKFEDTFRSELAEHLVDEKGEALKDPSAEDVATAEENTAAETKRRGEQWIRVFVVNGVRDKVMPEADAKADDDNNTVALEGLELRKTLKAMTVGVTEQ